MRKRNIHVQLWLSQREADALERNAKQAGVTQSAYLRHLIMGFAPRAAPSPDYFAMMRSLYSVANNLNQIARKAHVLNVIDVQRYDRCARMAEDAIREITASVILPRKLEKEELYAIKED